jgi:hypothetical protein
VNILVHGDVAESPETGFMFDNLDNLTLVLQMREKVVRFHGETRRLLFGVGLAREHRDCIASRIAWLEEAGEHDMGIWRPLLTIQGDEAALENMCECCWVKLDRVWADRQTQLWNLLPNYAGLGSWETLLAQRDADQGALVEGQEEKIES